MHFTIETINTGYLIVAEDEEGSMEKFAFEDLVDVLHVVKDYFEPGSKHDAARIYIERKPGLNHPDYKGD